MSGLARPAIHYCGRSGAKAVWSARAAMSPSLSAKRTSAFGRAAPGPGPGGLLLFCTSRSTATGVRSPHSIGAGTPHCGAATPKASSGREKNGRHGLSPQTVAVQTSGRVAETSHRATRPAPIVDRGRG